MLRPFARILGRKPASPSSASVYRDDHQAALARIDALEREIAELKAERARANERARASERATTAPLVASSRQLWLRAAPLAVAAVVALVTSYAFLASKHEQRRVEVASSRVIMTASDDLGLQLLTASDDLGLQLFVSVAPPTEADVETARTVPQLAYRERDDARAGLWITAVDPSGPAARAGLRRGDRIVSVGLSTVDDGHTAAEMMSDLCTPWRSRGRTVPWVVLRDGRELRIDVLLPGAA